MSLQKKTIIKAGLALLDKEGLDGLTLRKLAASMNVVASAIYWHIDNRRLLIDEMAEAILQEEFADLKPPEGDYVWQDWLIETMQRLRGAMLAHPDGARVVAGAHIYPAVTLAAIAETGLITLTSAGISLDKAHVIMLTCLSFTFGHSIEEQNSPGAKELENPEFQKIVNDFAKTYPVSMKAIKEDKKSPDELFVEMLRLIIY
jgi:TetR/AcrR family tetracycline transcriptional repressor